MNGEVAHNEKDIDVEEDIELAAEPEDTDVLEDILEVDNVGDISVEIDVAKLVAEIEAGETDAEVHKKEIHRRLEELKDQHEVDQELDSTYNFNLDDDL